MKGGESKMSNKAIIYCRVASHEQQSILPDSIKRQLLACINFAQKNDYEITDIVCEQGSGIKTNDELANVIKEIKSGEAKTIITQSLDRLARTLNLLNKTLLEVKNEGGEIKFTNEEDSPVNTLVRNMIFSANTAYRSIHSERIKQGILRRKEKLAAQYE